MALSSNPKKTPDMIDRLFEKLAAKGRMLVTAESCTGGMIATAITDKAGSSAFFERGFVTYSNQAKIDCLGVSEETLKKYGAVSAQTAKEMALGALKHSQANVALSVTGIAGPGGGSAEKPVGLVYIGYAVKGQDALAKEYNFKGMDREHVRLNTTKEALKILLSIL